ncbi:10059_t:CDS:2 [Acaulospora morrowiae]|uniref:10059_t:CDS:1 n=1 Tax=Acaulospora morrowiae TaxID=94023 RepID=A0A9N9CZJ8_9GLOM|nr:10059_t:CDS:2 [Acaulospora morrowiae]
MGRKNKTRHMGGTNEFEFDSSDDDLYATMNSRDSSPLGPHITPASRPNSGNFTSNSNRSASRHYSANSTKNKTILNSFDNPQDYIIIEVERIVLEPSKRQLSSTSSVVSPMNSESSNFAFVYRVQAKEVCIFMIQRKKEIAIFLDQLQKFYYAHEERKLVLTFKEKFKKSYYEFPYENLDCRIEIPNDPTEGQLDDVTNIIFSLGDFVEGELSRLANDVKEWNNVKFDESQVLNKFIKRKNEDILKISNVGSMNIKWQTNEMTLENNRTDRYNPSKNSMGNDRDRDINVNPVLTRNVSNIAFLDTDNYQMPHVGNEFKVISSRDSSSTSLLDTGNQIPQAANEANANLSRGSDGLSLRRDVDGDVKAPKSSQLFSESLLDSEVPHQSVYSSILDLHHRQTDTRFIQNDHSDAIVSTVNGSNEITPSIDNLQSLEGSDGMSEISGSTPNGNEALLHVTCIFMTRKYAMLMPFDTTLRQLVDKIEQSRKTKVSLSRLFYRNQIDDKISIFDEDDWSIAKKEAFITGSYMITLLFA